MKVKKNLIILSIILFMNITNVNLQDRAPPQLNVDYPGIPCGKELPKKEKDCTKYGTDSGMLCCYVLYNNKTRECQLMNENTAVSFGIKPKNNNFIDEEYWDCGNKSYYYNINIILFLILIFLY